MTETHFEPLVWSEADLADGVAVVHAAGEIDMFGAPLLERAVAAQLAGSARALILDLSAVSFLAAAGVTTIAGAVRRAGERDVAVRLVAHDRAVLRVLDLIGLDRLVPIHPSRDRAVATLRERDHTAAVADALMARVCR